MRIKPGGFTIVEMLLLVVIVGIIAVVSLPRLPGDTIIYFRVKNSARRVVSDLRLARTLAIAQRANYILDFSGNQYAIYRSSVVPANQFGETRVITSSINITGDSRFTFTLQGNTEVGSGSTLTFSEGGHVWTLTVTPATGMVGLAGG